MSVSKAFEGFAAVVLVVAGFVIAAVVYTIFTGIAIDQLWFWFAEPLGVPALTLPHAIGISLLIGMFTNRKADDDSKGWVRLIGMYAAPIVAILLGYIVTLFM